MILSSRKLFLFFKFKPPSLELVLRFPKAHQSYGDVSWSCPVVASEVPSVKTDVARQENTYSSRESRHLKCWLLKINPCWHDESFLHTTREVGCHWNHQVNDNPVDCLKLSRHFRMLKTSTAAGSSTCQVMRSPGCPSPGKTVWLRAHNRLS